MNNRYRHLVIWTAILTLIGAAVASGASAAVEFHSDSSTGNTIIEGVQTGNHVFEAAGSEITCTSAKFKGTQEGNNAPSIVVTAEYSGCTVELFGLFKVANEVKMNGCAYELRANGTAAVVNNDAKSCLSEPITYSGSSLGISYDIKVGPQTGLSAITYEGSTTVTNGTITVKPNVTGIAGTCTGSACSPAGSFTNGKYKTGPTKLSGFVDTGGVKGAQTAIWVS